ncbi:MAG TPA: T9SS type A sorting domain-containing protein [Ignavibacteria bacterium]|nr:T9SS type A sorting domain-containing protein [Ignavibacteria bacterium]
MKNKLLILFIISLFGNLSNIFSWDSTAAKFYPLAVGNLWSYRNTEHSFPNCSLSGFYDYLVRIDSLVLKPNGKRYYKFSDGILKRIDSASMNVYMYQGTGECLVDSLLARKNDTIRMCQNLRGYVYDTTSINFAGSLRKTLHIREFVIGTFSHKLTAGLGLYYRISCEGSGYEITLNGCIINGIQYGNIIGIEKTSTEIPSQFMLYQNYPNPFNPLTKIRFSLPSPSKGGVYKVSLIIYDILGRVVATLIPGGQEGLSPGTYEVEWNASGFASGVYFYRMLVNGELINSKKLIILK